MSQTDSAGGFKVSEGDWTCTECHNLNFARRSACNRCGRDRGQCAAIKKKKLGHEIGKAAAEKSRGLFSADDWQCNKCGNVNWARRQQCNVCNAPKFGEVEERTGFGGGYNDRGVVEYKQREDSDDEYDEFGRRKKSKSGRGGSKKSDDDEYQHHRRRDDDQRRKEDESRKKKVEEQQPQQQEEEEEEEEEEDDEDGDLSKYDLSDWGDLPAKPASAKQSRSRSRSPLTDRRRYD